MNWPLIHAARQAARRSINGDENALAIFLAEAGTYGADTEVAKAHFAEACEDLNHFAAEAKSVGEVLDFAKLNHLPDPEWLVSPLVQARRSTLLAAYAKTGKTLLAVQASLSVALGTKFLTKQEVTEPQHVVYLDYENGPEELKSTLDNLGVEYSTADGFANPALQEYFHYIPFPSAYALNQRENANAVLSVVQFYDAALLVGDTLGAVIHGNTDAALPYHEFDESMLQPLKKLGVGSLWLDHTGHAEGGRPAGSFNKMAKFDATVVLDEPGRGKPSKGSSHFLLRTVLARGGLFPKDSLHVIRSWPSVAYHVGDGQGLPLTDVVSYEDEVENLAMQAVMDLEDTDRTTTSKAWVKTHFGIGDEKARHVNERAKELLPEVSGGDEVAA